MSLLVVTLSIYAIFCAFIFYVCFYADSETSSLANLFLIKLPRWIFTGVERFFGPTVCQFLRSLSEMFLMITYLFIVLGSWSIMFCFGYPMITESTYVSDVHKYVGYVVFAACMTSWRYASRKSPGYITSMTIPKFDNYEYDNLMFVPNRICRTVGIRKLARSKYDIYANRHVARFDHFCGWLNNPIGEENYRYFLLFLFIHVGMCAYGSYVTANLFIGEIHEKRLWNAVFFNAATGEEVLVDWIILAHFLFAQHMCVGAVLVLMTCMTIALGLFLSFHLYLLFQNMTTNEYYKWKAIRKWYKQESTKYDEYLQKGGTPLKPGTSIPIDSATDNATNSSQSPVDMNDDNQVGCTGPSTVTTSTTTKTVNVDEDDIMNPGPKPENIYNLGILQNTYEVLYPRCLRPNAINRWREAYIKHRKQQQQQQVDSPLPERPNKKNK